MNTPDAPHALIRVARRDLNLASVRYRGLIPACALQDMGWHVGVVSGSDQPDAGARLAVAVKPLTEQEAAWARRACDAGLPVAVDLCDNIFIDGYGGQGDAIARRFASTAAAATCVTVPTSALRRAVIAATGLPGERVLVLPDIVETPALVRRQRRMLGQPVGRLAAVRERLARGLRRPRWRSAPRLFWFGNHGAAYASFGLSDLLLFREALEEAASRHGAELWVVSNHRARFDALAAQLRIRTRYFEWSPTAVDELLPAVDVCLVPNSLDPFSSTKSANRALKALAAGVPVVATPTSAYEGLEQALWLADPVEGISAYLSDPKMRLSHLQQARRAIARDHSIGALRAALRPLLQLASLEPDAKQ